MPVLARRMAVVPRWIHWGQGCLLVGQQVALACGVYVSHIPKIVIDTASGRPCSD
jgi:hypothetical protein